MTDKRGAAQFGWEGANEQMPTAQKIDGDPPSISCLLVLDFYHADSVKRCDTPRHCVSAMDPHQIFERVFPDI